MRKSILSSFLCLPLLFASCAQSMEEPGDGFGAHGKVVPLGVQASLAVSKGAAGGKEEASSRAGGTAINTPGAVIGVFLIDGSGTGGYKPVYNKKYSYTNEGTWSTTDPIYVDDRPGKVVAYYDPNNKVSFAEGSSVTTTLMEAQNYNADLLWYYDSPATTVSSENLASSTIAFQMKPAYAQLSFKISCNKNYPTSPCKVTQIVIKPADGSKFYTSGTLDIATGLLTGEPKDASYLINTSELPMGSTGIPAGGTDTSVNLLFPAPQTCKGLTLTLTVNGNKLSVTIPPEQFAPAGQSTGTLASGSQYTIHLYFTEESVIIFKGVETGDMVESPGIELPGGEI